MYICIYVLYASAWFIYRIERSYSKQVFTEKPKKQQRKTKQTMYLTFL